MRRRVFEMRTSARQLLHHRGMRFAVTACPSIQGSNVLLRTALGLCCRGVAKRQGNPQHWQRMFAREGS